MATLDAPRWEDLERVLAQCEDRGALWALVRELVASKLDAVLPGIKRRTG